MRRATTPREQTPGKTWNMCRPVMAKKLAPKSGGACGQRSAHSFANVEPGRTPNGRKPSVMRWFHSIEWSTMKTRPPSIVAPIQRRAAFRRLAAEARTAITIVKDEASRKSVITVEKMIEGLKGNGVGH